MTEARDRRLVVTMIAHGVRAGALRASAKTYPEAARGLVKAADFHTARAATLADEMLTRLAL